MVVFGMRNGIIHKANGLTQIDDSMEAMDVESAFSEAADAFGPNEFANTLSQNLSAHGTNAQKILAKHGLVAKYRRIAQEKWPHAPFQT